MSSETYTLTASAEEGEALDLLIRRAQEGDAAAFEEILSRFEGKALSIALNLGASRADAEDIAQDAFLKLFRHIGAYRGGRRFTAWFYRIVINAARDHLEKQRSASGSRQASGSETERGRLEPRSSGADPAAESERREQIRRALLSLSVREREVVILKELHGLSTWEVALILRLNPITVRRHAMQARARLRELLGDHR